MNDVSADAEKCTCYSQIARVLASLASKKEASGMLTSVAEIQLNKNAKSAIIWAKRRAIPGSQAGLRLFL